MKWGILKKVRVKAPQFPLFLFSWVALKSADGYMVDFVCKSVWTYIVKIHE